MKIKNATLFFIICSLFIISCDSDTKTQKGIISGVITLDGQQDYSGIRVMLYSADIVPGKLKELNDQYQQLAFPVEDKHIFDHRKFSPLFSVFTNKKGFFSFPETVYGKYIITYLKEGWGYNYIYDIELHSSEYNTNSIYIYRDLSLSPLLIVPSVLENDYIFYSDKCYYFPQNTMAFPVAKVTIEPSAKLLLGEGIEFSIYGELEICDGSNFAIMTSFSNIYETGVNSSKLGQRVIIYGTANKISNLRVSYLNSGLDIRAENQILRNASLCYNGTAMIAYQTANVTLSNSLIYANTNSEYASIIAYNVNGYNAINNIFYQNNISIRNKTLTNSTIRNNVFYGGNTEVENAFNSNCLFEHNIINNVGIGLDNTAQSNLEVNYNDITANVCIYNWFFPNVGNSPNEGWVQGTNNNFNAFRYTVESRAAYFLISSDLLLDFRNNYWGTTSETEIENKIIDSYDLGVPGGDYYWSIVNYKPYQHNRIISAGIK